MRGPAYVRSTEGHAPSSADAVAPGRAPPLDASQVAALVPCHRELPRPELITELRAAVSFVLVVDDGVPLPIHEERLGGHAGYGVALLRLSANTGKGHAIARGLAALLGRRPPPQAILVIDADGQHPPGAIPSFLAAAVDADLVIGDRLADAAAMPWERRLSNRLSSRLLGLTTGRTVRDSQCGMRLLRRRALHEIPFEGGGYEAESRHLKRCLRSGATVRWVPIPAIYDGEASSFRPFRDGVRVLLALLR